MKFSKVVVFFLFLTVLVFTAVVFYFAWHGKYVPEMLINRFFLAMLGEAGVIGAIKIAETIFEYRNMLAEKVKYVPSDEPDAETTQSYYEKLQPQDVPPLGDLNSFSDMYPPEVDHFAENEGWGFDPEDSPDDFEQVFPKGG